MDRAEYERLKAKIENQRKSGHEAIENRYNENLQSLENVWALSQDDSIPMNSLRAVSNIVAIGSMIQGMVARQGSTAISPVGIVRKALDAAPETFDMQVLHAMVGGKISKNAVSSALNKLAGSREIEVVEHGAGRRPTTYRKREIDILEPDLSESKSA